MVQTAMTIRQTLCIKLIKTSGLHMYSWQAMELLQIFSAWNLKQHETSWRRKRSGGDAFRRLPREQGGQLDSKHCVDTSGWWIWWGTGDHRWVEDLYQSITPTLSISKLQYCVWDCFRTHPQQTISSGWPWLGLGILRVMALCPSQRALGTGTNHWCVGLVDQGSGTSGERWATTMKRLAGSKALYR